MSTHPPNEVPVTVCYSHRDAIELLLQAEAQASPVLLRNFWKVFSPVTSAEKWDLTSTLKSKTPLNPNVTVCMSDEPHTSTRKLVFSETNKMPS